MQYCASSVLTVFAKIPLPRNITAVPVPPTITNTVIISRTSLRTSEKRESARLSATILETATAPPEAKIVSSS